MSIKKNIIYNIVLNIANVVFPFITVPYISRILGPEGVGISSFAITYAEYFGLFAALGIPMYGIREIAKVRDDKSLLNKVFSELFVINILSVLAFSIIYITSISFVKQLNEQKEILYAAGAILYLSFFSIDWFFSGLENFKLITLRSIIIKSLSIILLFLFVKERNDIIPYILVILFAKMGNNIWNLYALFKNGYKISVKEISLKRHLKPLLILYASAISISIYTMLDTLMLGFLSNYKEVAFYSSATKVSKLLLPIVISSGIVLLPRLAYYKQQNQMDEIVKVTKLSFSYITFFSIPLTFALIIIAPDFVPLFFGNQFEGTIIPLQIMSTLLVIIGLNNLAGVQILVGLGFDKYFMFSLLYGVFLNVIMNIILIPLLGAIGASISSVCAEVVILGATIYYSKKYANINFIELPVFVKNLLVTLLFIPLYWIIKYLNFTVLFSLLNFFICGSACYLIVQYFLLKNQILLNIVSTLYGKASEIKYLYFKNKH